VEEYSEGQKIGPFDDLRKIFPQVTFRRVFTVLTPDEIGKLVKRATQLDPTYRPPNFLTYFKVVSKPEADAMARAQAESLVKELRRWATVEWAYISPVFSDPTTNAPPNPLSANQGHLNPAPKGIGSQEVWTTGVPGGDGSVTTGSGLAMIDLEQGWNLDHDDLPTKGTKPLSGLIQANSRHHGTAVLGVICALDDGKGCIGIVPKLGSVQVISYIPAVANVPIKKANDILNASAKLSFGDVLVLETQADKPLSANSEATQQLPIELNDPAIIDNDPAIFDSIQLATALGIVVVEAAGNGKTDGSGGVDLDKYPQLDRANWQPNQNPDPDSGAIMVAAAQSAVVNTVGGSKGHKRMAQSNFGSRIDCYAWGEDVMTAAAEPTTLRTDLYTGDTGTGGEKIPLFGGTSAATAIVAGAALSVQGMAQAKGFRLSPKQLRAILSDTTPPTPGGPLTNAPSDDAIGVMPNLAWIHLNALPMAPDLYIRDFVGDIGDPHTGAISASPDIIVRNAREPDPTAAFGAGSGNENNAALISEVKAGQNNFIYVRVLNRGPAAAVNVTASIYWSPVATLVTPDLWTLVGSVNIPIVPPNLLTVSDAIVWPAASIPATGHYCFVGLIGNAADPAPNPAAFQDWANYQSFIRNNNNVTWRNFNVVSSEKCIIDDLDYVVLAFLAPGTPEKARRMRLEVTAQLPQGARVFLEGPPDFLDLFDSPSPFSKDDAERKVRLVPVNPHGRYSLGEALLPAKSRTKLQLLVHIPEKFRANAYEVYASQLFEGLEVGRVTWRLAPYREEGPGKQAG